MKGIQGGGGLGEVVVDGVGVAAERVQGGDLHPGAERLAAAGEPVPEHLPGAPGDQVQEPGMGASLLVTAQIHHARQHRGALLPHAVRGVMPHVLIDAKGGDAGEAGLIGGQLGQEGFDHPPLRVPGDAQLAGQAFDGGVLTAQLADRPPHRPRREHRPPTRQRGKFSVNVPAGQTVSGQAQVRCRHRSSTGDAEHGTSRSSRVRRPWQSATIPHRRHPCGSLGASMVIATWSPERTTATTWTPSKSTRVSIREQYESGVAQQVTVRLVIVEVLVEQLLGRY